MPPAETSPFRGLRERLARGLLFFYKRLLSPLLHTAALGQCRYLPTCSEYAYGAVSRYGFLRGSALALWRVLRCHPFARGGFDPVP